MIGRLFGPAHTFEEALVVLEQGLRSGEIVLSDEECDKSLLVANLPRSVNADELRGMFAVYGTVRSAQIVCDRPADRSKGYGIVEMATPEEAQAAASALHDKEVDGQKLSVHRAQNPAKDCEN